MNRSELLDKLAMELAEWPSSKLSCYQVNFNLPNSAKWTKGSGRFVAQSLRMPNFNITKNCWLQRRKELINCPPDSEAPEWAHWKAQDASGEWIWHEEEPEANDRQWDSDVTVDTADRSGKIPPGHRWQDTLTRINRGDNTSTPEEDEEFDRIQARQDADKPHEADARMLDAQLADAMGKQPRYLDATGEDWIDEFARTATLDEFRGAMRFTIGKYNRRVGRKDEVLKEVRKMKDYCARWEAYELSLSNQ